MNRADTLDAAPIVVRLMKHLAAIIPAAGSTGSQARAALGEVIANVATLLGTDTLGPPLADCFDLVRQAGATQKQFQQVRVYMDAEKPKALGGTLVKNSAVHLCLATEGQIIANMAFISRQDVDALKATLRTPFDTAEETAADDMDQTTFKLLIELDAAVTNYLVVSARPLPRMSGYQFAAVLPSLVLAYRLYQDASRADQIVAENKIVHPAFCPPAGIALSA